MNLKKKGFFLKEMDLKNLYDYADRISISYIPSTTHTQQNIPGELIENSLNNQITDYRNGYF